jgi:acetyltransferase-like isoleucine patch superfamily enzyme
MNDLLKQLRSLWRLRQQQVAQAYHRTLPLADYVVDRWEKARLLGFGEGSSIYDSALVFGDVTVGIYTWIGPFTILDGSGGLVIGDHCEISAGVQIYSHDTVQRAISGGVLPAQRNPTRIGSRCYLGPNVIVSRGVTIGDGCIVGANSFVNRDIPPGTKAWGTPARPVSRIALSVESINVPS